MKDLGQKMLDGTPVRGYRWWKTADGPSPKTTTEEWMSESLSLLVSHWEIQPTLEFQNVVSHLRSEEPDPTLFTVPKRAFRSNM